MQGRGRRARTTARLLASLLTLGAPAVAAEPAAVDPAEVVSAIEQAFGITPGERRNHTKGSCALGSFVGTPEAAAYSRSALFSGQVLPVIARFSLAGGNPRAPDTSRSPRGMALQFQLPGGGLQHITMLNTPVFGAAHPQTFLDLMRALRPDPATGKPDPARLEAFRASHPDSRNQAAFLASHNPPSSYAGSAYFGIHSFRFIDRDDRVTLVRWRFVPQDGEQRLSDAELKTAPPDFLEQALIERTRKGPVRWDMRVSLGEPGDPENDPTQAWPDSRREILAGTLTIHSARAQKGGACERINFDPLVMAEGIAPTQDPVLLLRSPAYALSFGKRLSGN